jgi:hypothetical protein
MISYGFPMVFPWFSGASPVLPVLPSHPAALRHALRAAPLLGGTPTPWSLGSGKIDGRCVGCLWDIIYIYIYLMYIYMIYIYI